ncbi:MAG: B12-binding domain-containing radical SAM protein [Candidatus Omnitrophica bacterium]|nr:B12-binding domain-containing radical SAM protein [Candidatus Omnitrophota bacterium]
MVGKVLLIRPKNTYNYNNYPSLGLISVATALKQKGYQVKIINCAFYEDYKERIMEQINDVDFVGITMLTAEVPNAYEILEMIKSKSDVAIVAGGWHCTLFPDQVMGSGMVDYVITGEGEKHIGIVADAIAGKRKLATTVFPKKIIDLNSLPLVDYAIDSDIEKFISNYLTDKLAQSASQPMRWLPYESSRGCPSLCTFCINVVTGNTNYRQKKANKVIDEIAQIVKRFDLTHVKIVDDNFFVDVMRARVICQGIIDRKLNITWDAECRCDYFNEKMLNDQTLTLARQAGLIQLTVGIESGSTHTLNLMKKGITLQQAENAIKKCDQHGIIGRASFILEIPGESAKDIKKTVKFINRLRRYKKFTCGAGTFRPYPKCELTVRLIEDGMLVEPVNLSDWADKKNMDMYTSAEYIRPWQINGVYSEAAALYINMESEARLGNHQISNWSDRFTNSFFIFLAKIRNRIMWYGFAWEKVLYKDFLLNFYRKRQEDEKKINA